MNLKRELAVIRTLREQLTNIEKSLKEAGTYTDAFLEVCKKHSIKKVAIGVPHSSVKSSIEWGGAHRTSGSVFADAEDDGKWPSIWKVARDAGVSGGAGNSGQHQLSLNAQALLIEGVYHYKAGKWKRLEGKEDK